MQRTSLSESLRVVEAEIAAGRPEQALARCQELQTQYPRALPIQRVLGEIYLALRKPREALGALDRVLAGDPEDARACCARAIVHQMHGDTMAALAWYRRACDIRPDDRDLRSTYGELARSLGQPAYRPSRAGLARLYLRGDLFVHAAREWETLIAEDSDNLEAQVGLAETHWRARQLPPAEERCRRILTNVPSCVKALLILSWIAQHGSRQDEAQRLMQRVAELDPDQRIAQLLFADEIATSDDTVMRLLGGAGVFAQSGAISSLRPGVSRPLAGSRPTAGSRPLADPQAASRPLSDTAAAPPDSQQAFRETAFMIWGPDEETREQAALRASGGQPRGGQPGGQVMPPALAAGSTGLDETEARQAMNWVNWLQAQGAVVRQDALAPGAMQQAGSRAGTGPLGQSLPAAGQAASAGFPAATPPAGWPDQAAGLSAHQTGPRPPPSPEDLRTMFAELEPQTGAQSVVDADVILGPLAERGRTHRDTAGPMPSYPHGRPATDAGDESPWPPASLPDNAAWAEGESLPEHLAALRDGGAEQQGGSSSAMTLETLEQQFAASGFQSFEPRPGALAEIAAHGESADETATDRAEPAHAIPPEPPEPPQLAGPAPDDYPARLALARQRREEGKLDEAMVEYRAVLKNAPNLFSDVLEDLRAGLAETPEHPELHRLLGDAYIRQGDYLSALESYNRALVLSQTQEQ